MCVTDWKTTWARPIECSRRCSKRAGAASPASIALLQGRLGVGGILPDPYALTQTAGRPCRRRHRETPLQERLEQVPVALDTRERVGGREDEQLRPALGGRVLDLLPADGHRH